MFFSKENSIDEQGREYLVERGLSIPHCVNCGIASRNGKIYFAFHQDGKLVRTKWRSIANKKEQGFEKLDESKKADFVMPLFNMVNWNASNSNGNGPRISRIVITEGEFDCVAFAQLAGSYCVSTSLPNGAASAESAIRNHAEYLAQFDEIYIAFDMDGPGQEAAEKVKKIIPPKKFRRINFPAGCKDANEWLEKENPTQEDAIFLMEKAEKIWIKEIIHISEVPDTYFDAIRIGEKTGFSNLDNMIGGVRKGEMTVISADTGSGKTTFGINLLVNLAKQKKNIWINSYEMKPEVIFRKIASQILERNMKFSNFDAGDVQRMRNWCTNSGVHLNIVNSKPDLLSIRKQLEICKYVYNIDYVLIDHLDYVQGTSKKTTLHERVDECVQTLHNYVLEFDIHLFLIAHPKQSADADGEVTLADLKGSSGIKQYADNVIILQRMNRKDPNMKTQVKVKIAKNRHSGQEGVIYLNYEKTTESYTVLLQPPEQRKVAEYDIQDVIDCVTTDA